jgi:thioredoxin 1
MAREISQSEFKSEVSGSSVPVLLDVYVEHCGPCRLLAPVIEKLAGEYEGRARVLKVDADVNRELAVRLGVSSLPTVVAFRGDQEVGRLVGLRGEPAYRELLETAGVS